MPGFWLEYRWLIVPVPKMEETGEKSGVESVGWGVGRGEDQESGLGHGVQMCTSVGEMSSSWNPVLREPSWVTVCVPDATKIYWVYLSTWK